jgi:hypothetical protein
VTEPNETPAENPEAASASFGEGFRWEGDDPVKLTAVVEAAFDYRGDVTVLLRTGEEVVGYLSNRYVAAGEPFLEILPADGSEPRRLAYHAVRGLAFSGRDAASGRSWESWVRKYEEKKKARERGEHAEGIGLFPEPLE